jgi:hypothetical protein
MSKPHQSPVPHTTYAVAACLGAMAVFGAGVFVYRAIRGIPIRPPTGTGSADIRPNIRLASETEGWDGVVEALLSAYDGVDVIALGEAHARKVDSDLRLRLIRHPDFPKKVHFIIVEFGNSLYQPLLDRYINGEDVPITELRHVWRDTTQIGGWNSVVYPEFLAAVREVNQTLPKAGRLRVIAGDPPIDWGKVRSRKEILAISSLRGFPVSLGKVAVMRGEKALMIYGTSHILRPRFELWAAEESAAVKTYLGAVLPPGTPAILKAVQVSNPGRVLAVEMLAGPDPIYEELEATLRSGKRPVLFPLPGMPSDRVLMSGATVDACVYFGNSRETGRLAGADPQSHADAAYEFETKRRIQLFGKEF